MNCIVAHTKDGLLGMYDVKMHVARAHKMKKARFSCRFCKQNFSTRYARDRHATTHTESVPDTDQMWQKVCQLQDEMSGKGVTNDDLLIVGTIS